MSRKFTAESLPPERVVKYSDSRGWFTMKRYEGSNKVTVMGSLGPEIDIDELEAMVISLRMEPDQRR